MKIKICGIRRDEDVSYINEFMPDYCGFILSQGFRRSINFNKFSQLEKSINKQILRVGVFVDENIEDIIRYEDKLDIIQLHGKENTEYIQKLREKTECEIWKAVRAKSIEDIENADKLGCGLLIDSFVKGKIGGTGQTADINLIKKAHFSKPFFLAGGLDSSNVLESINAFSSHSTKPIGVDISSGVETDGVKDWEKIKNIINLIRGGLTNE